MNDSSSKSILKDKICLITGATSGIGKATAKALAKMGATIVFISRSEARGEKTQQELIKKTKNPNITYIVADLSSLTQVAHAAEEFKNTYPYLNCLINNAGVYLHKRQFSVDGIEMTFAVNHLSHFLLTNLLLDKLKEGAPSRIINVSSAAHVDAELDLTDLNYEKRKYQGFAAYKASKLANILFTYKLAKILKGTKITVNAVHPGVVRTNIARQRKIVGLIWKMMPFFISPDKGAETTVYVATHPELENVTGKYFVNKKITPSSPLSYNETLQNELWTISEKMIKMFFKSY